MKIVVLTTCHEPNDDRIYYKEILSLLSIYKKVFLVAPVSNDESYNLVSGVELHPISRRKGILGRLRTVVEAAITVSRLKPDVCHFHDLDFIIMVPILRLILSSKIVYDSHELYPESMLTTPNIPLYLRPLAASTVNWIEKGCSRYCSLIITADSPTSESFLKTGIPTVTLFNYPKLELFSVIPKHVSDLAEAFIGRRVLIYQGTMSLDRGLFHMLDGLCMLKDYVPEVLLLLVGLNDVNLRNQANQHIRSNQLDNYVQIIPWVPHSEIASYISVAEIGLVPLQPNIKFNKNIPIKVFEYMACGIPLLGANLAPIAYYLANSRAGVVYDSTDAKAFADEAKHMLDDPSMRKSMSKAGRKSVERLWNWGEMEKILLDAYRELEIL